MYFFVCASFGVDVYSREMDVVEKAPICVPSVWNLSQ